MRHCQQLAILLSGYGLAGRPFAGPGGTDIDTSAHNFLNLNELAVMLAVISAIRSKSFRFAIREQW